MQNFPRHCDPFTNHCMTMQEWGVYWQAIGVLATVVFGLFGLYKIFQELRRLNEQRDKDRTDKEISAKLKRTEFFLNQHRRLFDNSELYEVLCLIDNDDQKLASHEMWDKKRKFLTFFEEIALLVKSEQINKEVAFYMFGYYAMCAKYGRNFCIGIHTSEEYWQLFYDFVKKAEEYFEKHKDGPPKSMSL